MMSMGRRPRIHYPGAVYHVMAKGVDGRNIFIDDTDRHAFLDTLNRVKRQTNTGVFAYCLMGNHFHLTVKVGNLKLGSFIQRILTPYVLTFNRRHERTGHLFHARYKSNLCVDDRYLTALIRYIHLNPVRAGFCALPEEWEWSSYREYQKSGRDGLVETADDFPDFDPWSNALEVELPSLIRPPTEPGQILTDLRSVIALEAGITDGELASGSRRPDVVIAKRKFIAQAVRRGHRMSRIAECLGVTPGAISYYLRNSY
jgi:REP element-mobilizing transposase RayT/DNA-binding CsgD family transcriptional regulator